MKISHAKKLAAALNKDFKSSALNGSHIAKVIDNKNPLYPLSRADVVILITEGMSTYCDVLFNHMNSVFKELDVLPGYHITKDHSNLNTVDFILTIF